MGFKVERVIEIVFSLLESFMTALLTIVDCVLVGLMKLFSSEMTWFAAALVCLFMVVRPH